MIKKLALAVFIALMTCSVATAQTTSLRIDGPYEVSPGTLVRLTANTIANETPFWIVLQPIDLDYEQVEEGKRLLFSAGCKSDQSITVVLLAQQVRDGRIVTRQIRRTIQVKAQAEIEMPGDTPAVPGDLPVTDSPLFEAVLQAWPAIRTDAAKDLSLRVAANIEAIASKCESGDITNVASIWKTLSKRNRETLGIESEAWNPVAKVLQTQFQRLALQNPQQHAVHLKAAAAAIGSAFSSNRTNQRRTINQRSPR